jgi:hypothetical protein
MSEKKQEGLKPFNELIKVDMSKLSQKKPTFYRDKAGKLHQTSPDKWLDYVEWAVVLQQLYEHGARSVGFWSKIREDKPFTLLIILHIDGVEYTIDYPMIDGNTIITSPNQMQLHKAELRGFVKAVAIHTGLGLGLWMKEEKSLETTTKDIVPEKTKKSDPVKNVSANKPKIDDDRLKKAFEQIKLGKYTSDALIMTFDINEDQQKELQQLIDELNKEKDGDKN